jgi:hypothetical protein
LNGLAPEKSKNSPKSLMPLADREEAIAHHERVDRLLQVDDKRQIVERCPRK